MKIKLLAALTGGFLLAGAAFAQDSDIVASIEADMVAVEGSTFSMGSFGNETNETPVHEVSLDDFYMLSTEVTQSQYKAVMGVNFSRFRGADRPVEEVSWYDAVVFCNKLSMLAGYVPVYSLDGSTNPDEWGDIPRIDAKDEDKARWNSITWNEDADGYRLPTEAEWEFAAKGGIKEEEDPIYSGSDVITDVAWNADTPDGETHDVAGKLPNALGLYDMSGNVWEWVWDWYGNYHTVDNSNPKGAEADVTGRKMRRGGSIKSDAVFCRNANRASSVPELRGVDLGFRIVRNADDDFLAGNADETESEDADDELPAGESEDEDSESDAEVAEVSSVVIVPESEDEDTPLISIDLDDEGNLVMDVDEDQALDSFGIER